MRRNLTLAVCIGCIAILDFPFKVLAQAHAKESRYQLLMDSDWKFFLGDDKTALHQALTITTGDSSICRMTGASKALSVRMHPRVVAADTCQRELAGTAKLSDCRHG